MICEICGHSHAHPGKVTETFRADGKVIVVEGIPAEICDRCGAASFSAEVAERVRRMIHGPHKAVRVIEAEVLDFQVA